MSDEQGDTELDHRVHLYVLGLLADAYGLMRQAWWASLRVQDCAENAPWNTWHDDDDPQGEARDVLVRAGEHSAITTAQAITRHLGLLCRAYGPDPAIPQGGPDADRWPYSAVYAPARAIGEGTGLVGWLLDPDTDRTERVHRGAALALWSDPGGWAATVEEAGLKIRRDRQPDDRDGPPYVWTGDASRPFSPGSATRNVHGRRAAGRTQRWSKLLHNDPGQLGPRSTFRTGESGAFIGLQLREDEHLELARDLAGMLRTAGERQAAYWGRQAYELMEACERVTTTIGEALPEITAYVQARHNRMLQ